MNNPIQFPFEFPEEISFALEDFIISQANVEAFHYIQNWSQWGKGKYSNFLILYGPRNSGKTHLAHIFSNITKAKFIQTKDLFTKHPSEIVQNSKFFILENFESLNDCESIIFHLINEIADQASFLLITTKILPLQFKFKLPDLDSRIKSLPLITINQPDDQLISTLLIKRFSDKQIRVSNEIINYLSSHIERSFTTINNIINYIDKKSIIEKKKVTLSLVKEVIGYLTEIKS